MNRGEKIVKKIFLINFFDDTESNILTTKCNIFGFCNFNGDYFINEISKMDCNNSH